MPNTHFISLTDATTMTTDFRSSKETILATRYKGVNTLPHCETFDRSAIDAVLAQTDCEKIRIYFGMDTDLKIHSIIVGVDDNDADMLPDGTNGFNILQNSYRCPTDCPPASDLNS